jgi:hypothetical protein
MDVISHAPEKHISETHPHEERIVHLRRCVSHYRVIRDARPDAFPISIHWRCVKLEHVSHNKTHPRHALVMCVINLIVGWGPYGTNARHAQDCTSLITKKSETYFILAHHRFNCRLRSL